MIAIRTALVLTCALALPGVGHAADSQGRYAVKGAGIGTCKQFLEEREKRSQAYYVFAGWVDGFLSANNRFNEDTYDLASWETNDVLTAYLAHHCGRNSDQRFGAAVIAMIEALKKERLTEASPPVQTTSGETTVTVYAEALRRAQEALAALGHYKATPDGQYGPATRKALEAFQTEKSLTVNGLPDQQTLFTLFRKPPQGQ
ncbi:MAG: peptidoglycan-binding protein [Ectothiorhodospiraceae bacterium]|nr:peptidoglycan-binding protein [Chromatiales bacterium]MCP5153733.1 peptidoglycan-binding protein [Ectothiorhodospiraceae bacterium]